MDGRRIERLSRSRTAVTTAQGAAPPESLQQAFGLGIQFGQRLARCPHGQRFVFNRNQQTCLQVGRHAPGLHQVALASSS